MIHRRSLALFLFSVLAPAVTALSVLLQDTELTVDEVRPGVHLVRGGGANVVVVASQQGALVIDTKLPRHRDLLLEEVRKLCDTAVRFVVNTHHHRENTGGNAGFSGATVIANAEAARRMIRRGDEVGLTFDSEVTLHLGSERATLVHVGPAHTDGDTVVYLASARTLVVGGLIADAVHPAILPEHGADLRAWTRVLADLRDRFSDPDLIVVPGDGRAGGIELIDRQLTYLRDLIEVVEDAHTHGLDLEEARESAEGLRRKYGRFHGEHFEQSLETAYRMLGGESR